MKRPTAFIAFVTKIQSFGWVDYTYGEDGLDNYEDTYEEQLAEIRETDLDTLLAKVREALPVRAGWASYGIEIATAKPGNDRYRVLIASDDDFAFWVFDMDEPEKLAAFVASMNEAA